MSKTILTKVDGFTPLPDLLVSKYGVTTAIVWGAAWRYCQMSDGICRAAMEKIAVRAGVSRQTAQKHMQILSDDGFFEDTTPDLKNKPHIYRDTGKVGMYNRFGIGVNQIDSTVYQIDSHCQPDIHEDNIKDRKEETVIDTTGTIFELYEQNIGLIHNITLSQEIGEYADLPVEWLEYAFKQAADANVRNWRYVRAVLESCKEKNGIQKKQQSFDEQLARAGYK